MDEVKEVLPNKDNQKMEVLVSKFADQSCSKCFGRGVIGRDVKSGQWLPCKCFIKKYRKYLQEQKIADSLQKAMFEALEETKAKEVQEKKDAEEKTEPVMAVVENPTA